VDVRQVDEPFLVSLASDDRRRSAMHGLPTEALDRVCGKNSGKRTYVGLGI
jgi:hypothetical protein